jgi:hypothetical protein
MRSMKTRWKLLLIVIGALLLRLALLVFVDHPGIADPNHYYNLGLRLVEGHGLTIDYIWQYFGPPPALVHAEDHWMPLAGILAAVGFTLFGEHLLGGLSLFILMGALIPLAGYAAARQFELREGTALFCAAAAGLLPEFVLNSLRTDTTIPNVLFITISVLLLGYGLHNTSIPGWKRALAFAGSGLMGGLAYLTRSDSLLLLPMLVVLLLLIARFEGRGLRGTGHVWLMPVVLLLVALPLWLNNQHTLGHPLPTGTSAMFFYADVLDHWAYGGTFTLQTLLERQTLPQLFGKRLFELAAAFKLMYTTLDVLLPVAVLGGALLLTLSRDRRRLLRFAPTLILLIGIVIAYPLLIPYKSQSGSFKKAYLTLIPLLLPLAGVALERAISQARLRAGTMLLALVFLTANAIELVRADARMTNTYAATMQQAAQAALTLPDTNGDGQIVLMAQDQFMLRYFGVRSIMLPMNDRDTILAVARRYGADYLMMPPDRPALDPIYKGAETDPRFEPVLRVAGTQVEFYRFNVEEQSE